MCNTREENAAELAQETALPVIPITRAELIENLMDDAENTGFDLSDYAYVVRHGVKGLIDHTNAELEQLALDWCLLDEDGNEVRYTITDADTSKPSAEAINHDLLTALKAAYVALSESDAWQDMGEEDDDLSVKIREAIAQAEKES